MLLPVAAFSGWYIAKGLPTKKSINYRSVSDAEYYMGLSFVLQNETDKAVGHLIKMLEVNSETVELHLALALLFRKKGEVDRSIRIHQNILARQDLSQILKYQVRYELGVDYYTAGLLDRAERVFSDLSNADIYSVKAAKLLAKVYEKEKNWLAAIASVRQCNDSSSSTCSSSQISHYYCELALEFIEASHFRDAADALEKARDAEFNNIRVNIIEADLLIKRHNYAGAIKQLLEVSNKNGLYISEIIDPLIRCYDEIKGQQNDAAFAPEVMSGCGSSHAQESHVVALAGTSSTEAALTFIEDNVKKKPSVQILRKYVTLLQAKVMDPEIKSSFAIINRFLDNLSDKPGAYLCYSCGYSGSRLFWQCPSCENWASLKPI